MFTEDEVYRFDFSEVEEGEILNLPLSRFLDAQAIKL